MLVYFGWYTYDADPATAFVYVQLGRTALMWATYGGHAAAVNVLLAAGANVNIQATPVAALRVQLSG
jgi:hypothetical protein